MIIYEIQAWDDGIPSFFFNHQRAAFLLLATSVVVEDEEFLVIVSVRSTISDLLPYAISILIYPHIIIVVVH